MVKQSRKQFDKYGVDLINQYVMELKSKLEKLAVITCYGYVSQTSDINEGDNKNVFYNDTFKCNFKRRRIDSISQFAKAVGLDGVNEFELKKLFNDGLPRATVTVTYWDKKQKKKISLTIKNFPPILLTVEHDKTGKKLGEYINVMAWDPIMHDWFSSIKSDVREALRQYTTRELNLGLRFINYYRENQKRRRGNKLVRNLSKKNVDKALEIADDKFPMEKDQIRALALKKSIDVGLIKGYKFFPDSKMFIAPNPETVLASVEELDDVTKQEMESVGKMKQPEMVTLVFKTESYPKIKKR